MARRCGRDRIGATGSFGEATPEKPPEAVQTASCLMGGLKSAFRPRCPLVANRHT